MGVNNQLPLVRVTSIAVPQDGPIATLRRIALVSAVALLVLPTTAKAQFFWGNDDGFDSDQVIPAPQPERPRVKHVRRAQKPAIIKETTKPKGPLLISISIEEQRLKVYDSNGLYAETPISTGMRGHSTPMGVFSVIGKEKFHRSNIYSGAPMPYMQRITWSGVAMHAGVLPGYPASHGCIRMPMNFAIRMYGWTRMGARVVIAPGELSPVDFSHPLLFTHRPEPKVTASAGTALPELKPILNLESGLQATNSIAAPIRTADASGTVPLTTGLATEPDKAKDNIKDNTGEAKSESATRPAPAKPAADAKPVKRTGHIAAFISRKEGKIFVRQNFAPLFEAPVTIADGGPLGTHVFTIRASKDDPKTFQWSVVSLPPRQPPVSAQARKHHRGESERATIEVALPSPSAALDRITVPDDAMQKIAEAVMPGDSLIVSDLGLGGETGLGTDFIVPLR
jgi:lipoprotein-anchoring transpeptidase ErfK/SrfK